MIIDKLFDLLTYHHDTPLIFNSGLFLVLFTLFIPFYYLLRKADTVRIFYVVLFSLYFYFKCSGWFFVLLLVTATVDFTIGHYLARTRDDSRRKWLVTISICFNLGMLGYFKYTNFIFSSIENLWYMLIGQTTSDTMSLTHFDIFLPVGISFFTFQSMSYVIDIYRKRITPLNRWIDYLFYVSFFPQLVAGPIVRAIDFIPQIHREPKVSKSEFGEGLFLILCGLLKKAVISDYISLNFVDRVFDAPTLYTGFENLMGIYGYALQIYCDFSGYSDIAIGIALWLGFRFNMNFDSPYQSATITEFWRRWHISLSTWLKDYLYISLGGNRKGRIRTYINLIITMFLGGLWHGANLRFVIWGLIHGVALAIHKMFLSIFPFLKKEGKDMNPVSRVLGVLLTFHIVCFAWVFFRASSMQTVFDMFEMIRYSFHPEVIPQFIMGYKMISGLILIGFITHFLPHKTMNKWQTAIAQSSLLTQALLFAIVMVIIVQFRSSGVQPFIYFQF